MKNQKSSSRPSEIQPEPGYYCHSLSIPLEVIEYIGTPLGRKNLTFTESHALLVGYVGMMVDWRRIGCWASDSYLASKLNKSVQRVEQMLHDCRELGFILDLGVQTIEAGGKTLRRRVLETRWVRVRLDTEQPYLPKPVRVGVPKPVRDNSESSEALQPLSDITKRPEIKEKSHFSKANALEKVRIRQSPNSDAPPIAFSDDFHGSQPTSRYEGSPARPTSVDGSDDPAPLKPSLKNTSKMDEFPLPPSPKDRPPKTKSDEGDAEIWAEMRSWLKAHQIPVTGDRTRQAAAVAILRRRLEAAGLSRDDLKRVWSWYRDNFDAVFASGRNIPKIRDAKEFDARWQWISDLERKSRAPQPTKTEEKIEISEEVSSLAKELTATLPWPPDAARVLPAVMAQSMKNLQAFLRRIKNSASDFADAARDLIPITINYLEYWFADVSKQILNWPEWNGDMGMFVWRPDHKKFRSQLLRHIEQYCGVRPEWDRVFRVLMEDTKNA